MMTRDEFKEEVAEFVKDCCREYTDSPIRVLFDFSEEDPTALIELKDLWGNRYEVPICLSEYDRTPAIDIGIDGATLELDPAGLYCFLWQEACKRDAQEQGGAEKT